VGFEHISSLIVGPMKSIKNNLYETPVNAIRKKCIDCCNGQYEEIRNCTIINCALYPYRMGHRPDTATIDTIKDYYDEK
jgi:hypothetical protein